MKYIVKGYAFVPVEVEISLEADSEKEAKKVAKYIFENSQTKHRFIVPNSQSECGVFDFEPSEVVENGF